MIYKTYIGIEVLGSGLRIAVVQRLFGKLRLIQSSTIDDFEKLTEPEFKNRLILLLGRYRDRGARMSIVLPKKEGVVRQIELPVEVRKRLRDAVELQIDGLSPWPSNEIYWDCSYELPGKSDKTFTVTVALMPKVILAGWIALFQSLRLPLFGASLSSLAWAHGVRTLWPDPIPTIIIGRGTEGLEGAVLSHGRLTALMSEGSGAGLKEQADALVQKLKAVGRIDAEGTVRIVENGSTEPIFAGSKSLLLPVKNAVTRSTEFFGAIAGALIGIGAGSFASNLVPQEARFRRNHGLLVPTYALSVVLLLLICGLASREVYQGSLYAAQLDAEIEQLRPAITEILNSENELTEVSEKYAALSALFLEPGLNLRALEELVRILPLDTWLTTYNLQGAVVTMTGASRSASELQRILEESPLYRDVEFVTSVTRDPLGKDQFMIRANVVTE